MDKRNIMKTYGKLPVQTTIRHALLANEYTYQTHRSVVQILSWYIHLPKTSTILPRYDYLLEDQLKHLAHRCRYEDGHHWRLGHQLSCTCCDHRWKEGLKTIFSHCCISTFPRRTSPWVHSVGSLAPKALYQVEYIAVTPTVCYKKKMYNEKDCGAIYITLSRISAIATPICMKLLCYVCSNVFINTMCIL